MNVYRVFFDDKDNHTIIDVYFPIQLSMVNIKSHCTRIAQKLNKKVVTITIYSNLTETVLSQKINDKWQDYEPVDDYDYNGYVP